ncbi:MAG: PD-(D/E)XK nuclease family protein, partial [Coriobacteriales bacterium]|nr:PD-(D/E)XK nuclease family protein [Coriobacteriales bacterium]
MLYNGYIKDSGEPEKDQPMNEEEKQQLRDLLISLQLANLNKPRRKPTFMEVAGIECREISVSKILAFLLDTEAEHGMGDLWLQSLLLAASDVNPAFSPSSMQIAPSSSQTEVATDNNLRIDVVVETPDLVLGIENKIDAGLYNDLGEYAGKVRDMAKHKTPLLLTLTLHDERSKTGKWASRCHGIGVELCNVTYSALFAYVKDGIGETMLAADHEWLSFVRDFMKSIENLEEPAMEMDRELFDFFGENLDTIKFMKSKMKEVSRATRTQADRLIVLLNDDDGFKSFGIGKPHIYQPSGDYNLSCGIYYDVPIAIKGPKGNPHAHPEITNRVSDIEIACWVAKGAKATVRAALTGA